MCALHALIKPQNKGKILHRSGLQQWPARGDEIVAGAQQASRDRLGFDPPLHQPADGEYFLAGGIEAADMPRAMGLALLLSRGLPGLWLVLGRLLVRDGRFFRRERGYKLKLVEARNVRLTREIRTALRGLI